MAEVNPAGVLSVLCARGCGTALEVDQQMVTNMVTLNQPLVFQHAPGQCPTELAAAAAPPPVMRRFRVQILAYEIGHLDQPEPDVAAGAWAVHVPGAELLGGLGTTVEAATYPAAMNGPVTSWLADPVNVTTDGRKLSAWQQFLEQAGFAELPTAPLPEPELEPEPAPERRTGPGGAVLL